jgi:hypothetical protein
MKTPFGTVPAYGRRISNAPSAYRRKERENLMGMLRALLAVVLTGASAAFGAEATKGPPPTWPWPGPTPPEIRKSLMTERIWQPSDQELKQMEAVAPDKAPAPPAKSRKLLIYDQGYVPTPPYSRKKVRVLLSLDLTQMPDPTEGPKMGWLKENVKRLEAFTGREKDYPISWIKPYGRGRVFYCSSGVYKPPYSSPLFMQYLLAGIQFALGDLDGDLTPSEK